MPRKHRTYDVDPDGLPVEVEEEGDLRPFRNEHRARMMALKDLANRLAKLPPGARREIPMDEDLRGEIDALAAAGQRPDRRRVLMRAQKLLAQVDLERLEAALAGDTPSAALERRVVGWRDRVLLGGDESIQAFVEAFPEADRQALRASAREARATDAPRDAQARLMRHLRDAIRRGLGPGPGDAGATG
jgi:ribosome-associated protein